MSIQNNVKRILAELPVGVELVAAVKGRSAEEVRAATAAGICTVGDNYVQEAEQHRQVLGGSVRWHFIGHLQKNKVKKAVAIFDLLETLDSVVLAAEIDRQCARLARVLPVFIEVNSGREVQKSGVIPENAEKLLRAIAQYQNIRVTGLMTMGPVVPQPESLRPYFAETRRLFETLKRLDIPGVRLSCLSMGMSDSYRIAIEEGATVVRIGRLIFEG